MKTILTLLLAFCAFVAQAQCLKPDLSLTVTNYPGRPLVIVVSWEDTPQCLWTLIGTRAADPSHPETIWEEVQPAFGPFIRFDRTNGIVQLRCVHVAYVDLLMEQPDDPPTMFAPYQGSFDLRPYIRMPRR